MELKTAIKLIEKGIPAAHETAVWVDLGAGKGLFTKALASLLLPKIKIIAVDRDRSALHSIELPNTVSLETVVGDYTALENLPQQINGVLMTNSLHYISNHSEFLKKLKSKLTSDGRIILVEYDLSASNQWVPFPISKKKLKDICKEAGLLPEFLGETTSIYQSANIYSAVLTF
jgi:trans-aconitate methyltransferase